MFLLSLCSYFEIGTFSVVFLLRLAILLAFELMETAEELSQTMHAKCELTIGINTGPIVGTIIGTRRRYFRIFGDAVNMT